MPALRRLTKDFVDLNLTLKEQADPKPLSEEDYVHSCACAVLSMGLLLMEFAMREGDGSRILQCWKYFLPLFKAKHHKNYAIEAFTLLAQYEYLLSPRMAINATKVEPYNKCSWTCWKIFQEICTWNI